MQCRISHYIIVSNATLHLTCQSICNFILSFIVIFCHIPKLISFFLFNSVNVLSTHVLKNMQLSWWWLMRDSISSECILSLASKCIVIRYNPTAYVHVTLIPGSVKSGSQFTDGIPCLVKVMLPQKHLNIIKLCVREYFSHVCCFLFHLKTSIHVYPRRVFHGFFMGFCKQKCSNL